MYKLSRNETNTSLAAAVASVAVIVVAFASMSGPAYADHDQEHVVQNFKGGLSALEARIWDCENGTKNPDGTLRCLGIEGPTGPQGLQGPTGPQGDPGVAGDTGATGDQGPQGDPGVEGATGPTGPAGSTELLEELIDVLENRIFGLEQVLFSPTVNLSGNRASSREFYTEGIIGDKLFGELFPGIRIAVNANIIDPSEGLPLTSLTLEFSPLDGDSEVLHVFTLPGGITVDPTATGEGGTLKLIGEATLLQYGSVLRQIRYENSAIDPTIGERIISVVAENQFAESLPSPATIEVVDGSIVFVTKEVFRAHNDTSQNLQRPPIESVEASNTHCETAAQNAELHTSSFKVWLSDDNTSPFDNFDQSIEYYFLLDGQVVADAWFRFAQGHQIPINIDELGDIAHGLVWTGVENGGTPAQDFGGDRFNCKNWNSQESFLDRGAAGSLSNGDLWTFAEESACFNSGHLYCVEQ